MPLFSRGSDIIRVNSYVLYKEKAYDYPDVNDNDIFVQDDNFSARRILRNLYRNSSEPTAAYPR